MSSPATQRITTRILLADADATDALAARLRHCLLAGDVLLLSGPIGAGKSHFARALIAALLADAGAVEDIPSPTFTLVQTYVANGLEIWHADLYRLGNLDEVHELGLIDAFDTALCLVEWPDRLQGACPARSIHLDFAQGDREQARRLTISAQPPEWSRICVAFDGLAGDATHD